MFTMFSTSDRHDASPTVTILLLMWIGTFCWTRADNDSPAVDEFCNGETFRPRCAGGKNDVIVMLTARYGRMSFGRCLKKGPGFASMVNDTMFLGCSADVKDVIDRHCSGRSECDVRINDQNFEDVKPCYDDLKMHLEASFICLKVAGESRHCTIGLTVEPQHVVGGSRSRLVQSDTVGCGVESQPWSVEALAGQRIAVSIINFDNSHNDSSSLAGCNPMYGYIVDRNTRRNVSICGGQSSRGGRQQTGMPSAVYVSSSNHLQITTKDSITNKFIVRVEAVGCTDLAPPSDAAWLKRVDDQITVGCYMSRQSWQLNCVNGVWTGTVGVCTSHTDNYDRATESQSSPITDQESRNRTEVAALAAVASAGVAVCCLVICVGVMCLRRQQRLANKKACSVNRGQDNGNYNEINRLNAGLIVNMTTSKNDIMS